MNTSKIVTAVLVWGCAFSAFSSVENSERSPGGIPKTYVGLLFDVMQTKPENILANADQFAEHAPYLDGVAIGLHDIPVTDAEEGGF